MLLLHGKQKGFTIVELLIVIVIIGILAAITIISYNGIQQRARNASTIATVQLYVKGLAMYLVDHGDYPTVNSTICLGSTYKDYNGDGVGDCGYVDQDYRGSVNTTFENQMKPYIASLPDVSTVEIQSFSDVMVGAFLNNWAEMTLDGQPNPYYIMYNLEGADQDCKLDTAQTDGTWPHMIHSSANYTWTDTGHNSTTCVIPLVNP